MFRYFFHYDKETGKLIGFDKGTKFMTKETFEKNTPSRRTVEVTKEEFDNVAKTNS